MTISKAVACVSLLLTAIVALLLSAGASAQKSPSGDATRGKKLYYDHGCYGCHGFNGETGVRRLVGTGSSILESPDTFIAFLRLRADAQPMLPSSGMPSYPVAALSDAEARDIYSYVRTFTLNAPDPKGIPALQTIVDSARTPYKGPRGP